MFRLRRKKLDRNLPSHYESKSASPGPDEHGQRPFLSLRTAFILTAALGGAAAAGVLAYLGGARPAQAVLTGLGAFGVAVTLLHTLVD
jgi:hypothetical protein